MTAGLKQKKVDREFLGKNRIQLIIVNISTKWMGFLFFEQALRHNIIKKRWLWIER